MLKPAKILFIVFAINFAVFLFLLCFFGNEGYKEWMFN